MSTKVVVRPMGRPNNLAEGGGGPRGLSKLLHERAVRRPGFSGCWTAATLPLDRTVLDEYEVARAKVSIVSNDEGGEVLYHLTPWEYGLPDPWVSALVKVMQRIPFLPPPSITASPEELRAHVRETSARLLRACASSEEVDLGRGIEERERNIALLSEVTARYTVGLGLFEVLLNDDRLEDVFVDAPSWENPVHVTVSGIKGSAGLCRCVTNVTVSEDEVAKLASRLRQTSGRPFSEAYPVMETDVEGYDSRATVIGPPLSPDGTAVALRRHSRTPWTLLKLAYNGSLDVRTTALLSFLIDGRSTMLICGARGAGKSSLLSALMFEFPLSQRILTIEDTLELPSRRMQALGYKVQSLFVETRMDSSNEEVADQALRVSLRLGESAIVLGEVRGKEAHTLYESMRAGRAGSSVLGTIHGESAISVYERVVHDMGIPREAFLATDIVLTMGLSRPGGSSHAVRRLVEVAECQKCGEGVLFGQLLRRDPGSGSGALDLSTRSKVVARIAASWDMSEADAVANIEARTAMREVLLRAARTQGQQFLEPEWVIRCNEFLRGRVDEGDLDFGRAADDFKALVERRCGHEL